jgi:hypothetical protein
MRRLCGLATCASMVVLITLAAVPAEGRPGGKGGKAGGGKGGGNDAKAVKVLKEALEMVKKAPEHYGGHRVEAAHSLEHAIKQLEEASSSGSDSTKGKGKSKGKGKGKESKVGKGTRGKNKAGGKPAAETKHATEHVEQAISHLQQAIKFHEGKLEEDRKTGKTPKFVRGGLGQALKLVNQAKKMLGKK